MTKDVRPYSLFLWLVVPIMVLLWLVMSPPHALDLAVSKIYYDGHHWPWRGNQSIEAFLHLGPKLIAISVALFGLVMLAFDGYGRLGKRPRRVLDKSVRFRLLYVLGSMLICVTTVWFLKKMTGVACPWDLAIFGASETLRDPSWQWTFLSGNCWPSGAAGSTFCVLGLYFAIRDYQPKWAPVLLAAIVAFGLAVGYGRIMVGSHFVSHVLGSLVVDWLICAVLYMLCFDTRRIVARLKALVSAGRCGSCQQDERWPMWLVIVFSALWWVVVYDSPLWMDLLAKSSDWPMLRLVVTMIVAFSVVAAAFITLLSALPRALFVILMIILNLLGTTAYLAAHLYGAIMTPDMIRNFLATDTNEALGYVSLSTTWSFIVAAVPPIFALFLAKAATRPSWARRMKRALWVVLTAVVLLVVGVGVLATDLKAFSGAMRADKTLRYQIAPFNVIWATIATTKNDDNPDAVRDRLILDPHPTQTVQVKEPMIFVVVVGETTRSANWQLAGYSRPTTPDLAQLTDLYSYPETVSCGTNTDVSVPCMMSRIGRSDYDRQRILKEEPLPTLLSRAGFQVKWIDNQSGCKGACYKVPTRHTTCENNGHCFDMTLADELDKEIAEAKKTGQPTVIFLHMLGAHGPAYTDRSPEADKPFKPECKARDLASCSQEGLQNAYDNSVYYTNKVLSRMIASLRKAGQSGMATGLLYVSDHGESLGESGLYLHGAPYWIAPKEQTHVPMILWLDPAFIQAYQTPTQNLKAHEKGSTSHENLYHTVLGLLKVKSSTYRPQYDLTQPVK